MFELVRRNRNIDFFMKKLIRAARDLIELAHFRSSKKVSEGKIGHFQGSHLHNEAMNKLNFRSSSIRPKKAQKQSYLSIGFRMRGAEKRTRPTQAPG